MRRAGLVMVFAACASEPPPIEPPDPEITLVVTSPAPGAELLGDPEIVIAGTVATTDPDRGALEAWVNGVRIEVAADGTFAATLAPALGINHVKIEGGDGLGPLIGHELDVLWAPAYLPSIAGTTGFDLAGAIELRLGQRFFDGRLFGTTLELATDPVAAGDLGAALELILWHVDLAGLLAGGLQLGSGSSSIDVTIPSATPDNIVVDAKIIHDPLPAIDLTIDLRGVFLEMAGTFVFGNRTLVIAGGIGADMHAAARLTLGLAEDGSIEVEVTNITATVGPLVPSFQGPDGEELDAFITIGNNDFRLLVEDLIAAELIPAFTDRVPPLLETLLGATDTLLDDVTFMLDTGLGTPVAVQIDGAIGALDVMAGPAFGTSPGHVTVLQDLSIRTSGGTSGTPVHPASRGAAELDAMTMRPGASTASVHLALRQDFFNALLHALWNTGLLEGQTTFGSITAAVSARLPPIVIPTPPESACTIDGQRCDLLLQLGQIEVGLPDLEQSFGVHALAGARVVVDGNTVSLVIQDVPELRVWETSTASGVLTPEAVEDLILNLVWPELFGAIGDNLSITLPVPDLAALGLDTLAPGLADAELELLMRHRPDVSAAYLGIGADLVLETPPPP